MYKSYLSTFIAIVFFFSTNLIAEENLFEKNYVLQSPEGFKSFEQMPDTKIMRGWDKDTDNVMMLENGYDFMGFSGFVSTNLPPSVALEHGQKIKADLILENSSGMTIDSVW